MSAAAALAALAIGVALAADLAAIRARLAASLVASLSETAGTAPADPAPAPTGEARPIVALARLQPRDDTRAIALPFGAGDARIATLAVEEGDWVDAGDTIAVLDSLAVLAATRDSAAAAVAVRQAELAQTRLAIRVGRGEARAAHDAAEAALMLAEAERTRARALHGRGVAATAALDRAEAAFADATTALDRAGATLSRYDGADDGTQPDLILARRALAAARADLARAEADLAKGRVVAPAAGTVLAIHARPGERPGPAGVASIGDTRRMVAEAEVYQADIGRVAVGRPASLTAEPLGPEPLTGEVVRIGLRVGRQGMVAADPAANTDARVVEVTIRLDPASSARAAGLTGLEVTARIAGRGAP